MSLRFSVFAILLFPLVSGCNSDQFAISSGAQIQSSSTGLVAPTISFSAGTTSPSVFATPPTFTISHVSSGDTVELYSDSTCTTLVGSGVATGSSISIQSSALAVGSYDFAVKRTNSSGTSPCSTESVNFTYTTCPTGYVPVLPNMAVGTTHEFCVMKFEAKDDGGGLPVSTAAGMPWANITASTAKTRCKLNGANYDLISNAEWMTIARDLEAEPSNWTSGVVGLERLYQGHSDNGALLEVTDENDPYDGTGNSSTDPVGAGKEQRRTHTLSTGDTIWDLSGNNAEFVDWELGGSMTYAPNTCFPGAWQTRDFPIFSCNDFAASEYMPANPAGVTAADYDRDYGLGAIRWPGVWYGNTISRGGATNFTESGIFHVNYNQSTDSWGGTGFRCVYRPN